MPLPLTFAHVHLGGPGLALTISDGIAGIVSDGFPLDSAAGITPAQAERDRLAAEQRAKEAAAQAEPDRVAAAEKAERDRIEAERKAEADKLAAVEKAKRDAEAAAQRERERIEAEKRAEEAAAAAREADKAHRATVNRGAVQALVAAGVADAEAVKAVTAIAKGKVPSVHISY